MSDKKQTHRELSRSNWIPSIGTESSTESIQLGCLLRIADATEAMSKNHTQLIIENKYLKNSRKHYLDLAHNRSRSLSAYKGHNTRLKKQLDAAKAEIDRLSRENNLLINPPII